MDYFAPLGFQSTFGRVYHVFQKRWKGFLGISCLVYFAGLLFAILTALLMGSDLQIDGFSIQPQFSVHLSQTQNGNTSSYGLQGWQLAVYWIEVFIYYCFSCIAHGATVWLAAHLYLEQYPSIRDGLSNAGTKVLALTWSIIVIGIITMVPCIVIIATLGNLDLVVAMVVVAIFAVFMQIVFYHVYPAIMVENLGPIQSLSRSYEISSGHKCFIFGILFAWGFLRFIIGFLVGLLAQSGVQWELSDYNDDYWANGGVPQVSFEWQYYLAKVLDVSFGILFLTLESVFQAVLYLRNRAANESLDSVGLATALGSTEDGDYITMTAPSSSNEESRNDKSAKEVDSKALV